jgi:hypothetical protein
MADKSNTQHQAPKRRVRNQAINIRDFENEHLDDNDDEVIVKTETQAVAALNYDEEEANEEDEENLYNMEIEKDRETLSKVNSDKISDIVISMILKNVSLHSF